MDRYLGVDVSHHNGRLDWQGLVDAGVLFGFAKATQGLGFVDSQYSRNVSEMKRLGVIPGAYHWLESGDPAGQARHFIDVVGDTDGLNLALDVEDPVEKPQESDVRGFLKELRQLARGHKVFIYTGSPYWGRIGNPKLSLAPHPLWHANYGNNTPTPIEDLDLRTVDFAVSYGSWKKATIRQFKSRALFQGNNIDVNAFEGRLTTLQGYAKLPQ